MRLKNGAISITIICLILGSIIGIQFRSVKINNQISDVERKSLDELRAELIEQKDINEGLQKRCNELENEVISYENADLQSSTVEENLQNEVKRLRIIAGLSDVKGQGVVITLSDNDQAIVSGNNILDLVNELKASDAEAISINNERVIATTEIREAGNYIMVNGIRQDRPFVIKAIGDSEKLEHTLKMIGGIVERLQEYYFIDVNLEKKNEIEIPKVKDDGTIIRIDMLTPIDS